MRSIRWRALLVAALALTLAVGLAACGSKKKTSSTGAPSGQPGKGKPPVKLGTKDFTEEFILGQLYKQALEAKGFTVSFKNSVGSSEVIDKALTSGQIDAYPEYTGVVVSTLAHQTKRPSSAADAYKVAKAFQEKRGFTLLDPTPFFDADSLAVKPAYAQKNGLRQVGDLTKVKHFTYGAPPTSKTRFEGVIGMKQVYKLNNFTFKPLAIGLQYKALDNGDVQTATVFTTDGQLQGNKYTELSDPKNVFGFQNVAPVFSKKVLANEGQAFNQTVNATSALLSTEAMRRMNAAVVLDKQDPAAVASAFLKANNLK
jgi:osmoprotectant transport system substrate-binding protein